MTTSTTPTTPRLSEVARHLVLPDGIVTSNFPRVYRRLRSVDVRFDRWQEGLGTAALGCRADGLYAATIGGVTGSLVRQVGKTFTVGNLLIGLALEFPGTRIVWTSHHNRTTTNTFRSMQAMVRRKKLRALLAPNGIRTANGEQEIRFANGSIIMFGAREHGFGRGMDAIDVLVFDEAQILSIKALEDMVPATNQARHPHGALVFFIGTPPRPSDDGEAFTAKRKRALDGKLKDGLYVEIGAEPGDDSDDQSVWPRMNPSFPDRTPLESMLRMRENIPDDASWRREAMGIWDDAGASHIVDPVAWRRQGVSRSPQPTRVGYSVDMTPTLSEASIGVAVPRPRGAGVHVEVAAHAPTSHGWAWVVDWLAERKGPPVAIQAQSPARALVPELKKHGVNVLLISTADTAGACSTFIENVRSKRLTHPKSELLNTAVAGATAKRHNAEGGVLYNRRDVSVVISPLYAVTLAAHALATRPKRRRKAAVKRIR